MTTEKEKDKEPEYVPFSRFHDSGSKECPIVTIEAVDWEELRKYWTIKVE